MTSPHRLPILARIGCALGVIGLLMGLVTLAVTPEASYTFFGGAAACFALAFITVRAHRFHARVEDSGPPSAGLIIYGLVVGVAFIAIGVAAILSGLGEGVGHLLLGWVAGILSLIIGVACVVAVVLPSFRSD